MARKGGPANKANGLPRATHVDPERPLRIGDIEIRCYVPENGTRLITNRALQRTLDRAESGGAQRLANLVGVLGGKGINIKDLTSRIETPIEFRLPGVGSRAFGYEATVLADLCDVILEARKAGVLQQQQEHFADRAEILARGFMRVGIIALVDEATGYQEVRTRDALARVLEDHVTNELRRWVSTFLPAFYSELFRLRGLPHDGTTEHPRHIAGLSDDLVFQRLPPEVRRALGAGKPAYGGPGWHPRHNRRLTGVGGPPEFGQHLGVVIAVMKLSDTWEQFLERLDRVLPRQTDAPPPA
jgi:hypothetical protein